MGPDQSLSVSNKLVSVIAVLRPSTSCIGLKVRIFNRSSCISIYPNSKRNLINRGRDIAESVNIDVLISDI
jgi:hypothetical protein